MLAGRSSVNKMLYLLERKTSFFPINVELQFVRLS